MLEGMDGSIDALLGVDPARVGHDERLDLLIGLEQARAALDAHAQQALALLAREGDAEARQKEWVREEVAAALRIAPVTAAARLHDATELVERLPQTLDRLVDGTLTMGHARTLIERTRRLDDATTAEVESRVLRRAGEQTISEFRRAVRRAVLSLDPVGADQRHRDAVAERRVVHSADEDGMAWIGAYLRADDAAHLYGTVDALAAGLDDARSADQKRADVLVALADQASAGVGTRYQGRRPGVEVTVALSTLLGIDDQPGELTGHGPIPAALARAIAADQSGTWRRLVTDPVGRLLDYGQTAYRPPAGLRDYLLAEHATCTFPGCARASRKRETDHVVPFSQGGHTSKENLHPPCGRHHHTRHDGGWRISKTGDGTVTWTSPAGRSYATAPTEHPVDITFGRPDGHTATGDPPPYIPDQPTGAALLGPPRKPRVPPSDTDPPPF